MRLPLRSALLAALLVPGGPAAAITPNADELAMAGMIVGHPQQQRPAMVYDPILHVVARAKAHDLAERAYFNHADPDGYGPNKAVKLAGYELPAWWGDALDTNYIESLVAGFASTAAAFNALVGSPGHRDHILGEEPFYAEQTRYAVGYANVPGSPHTRYFVFVSAPPNLGANPALQPYTEWLFTHFKPKQIHLENDASDANRNSIPRVVEFALGLDPRSPGHLPPPVFNKAQQRLEWTLPIRPDLGSVRVAVEHRELPLTSAWSSNNVVRTGSMFSSPPGSSGFLRITAFRE